MNGQTLVTVDSGSAASLNGITWPSLIRALSNSSPMTDMAMTVGEPDRGPW